MLPAHQHFSAHAVPVLVGLGLQIQLQLACWNATAQVVFNQKAFICRLGHAGLEHDHSPKAGLLGMVQSYAGPAQGVITRDIRTTRHHFCAADTAAHRNFFRRFLQPQWRLEGFTQGIGCHLDHILHKHAIFAHVLQHHSKLIGRNAGDKGRLGQRLYQSDAQGPEQGIAAHAAAYIVKGCKPVHVQQQHAMAHFVVQTFALRQLLELANQLRAIGQASEWIKVRQVMNMQGG